MSRWVNYNANPDHNRTTDCVIRAISTALDEDWDSIFAIISAYAFDMKNTMDSNEVWSEFLWDKGFEREAIKHRGRYTVEDFCHDHPTGTYLLAIEGHLVCVKDGFYWDAWDSGQEIPVYYWERKEG